MCILCRWEESLWSSGAGKTAPVEKYLAPIVISTPQEMVKTKADPGGTASAQPKSTRDGEDTHVLRIGGVY
jgi:hypothetical protein